MKSTIILHEIDTGREGIAFQTDEVIKAPDWSPDRAWIWFNSDHNGALPDLRRDGSALQRKTQDDRLYGFARPLPDGRHVLYQAYGGHVTGHPRDEEVECRQTAARPAQWPIAPAGKA